MRKKLYLLGRTNKRRSYHGEILYKPPRANDTGMANGSSRTFTGDALKEAGFVSE